MKNKAQILTLYDFIFPFTKSNVPLTPQIKKLLEQSAKANQRKPLNIECLGLTKKMERVSGRIQDNEERFYDLGTLLELTYKVEDLAKVEVVASECVKLVRLKHIPDQFFSPNKSVVLENFNSKDEFNSKDLFFSKESKCQGCYYEKFEREQVKKINKQDAESLLNDLLNLRKLISNKFGTVGLSTHTLENPLANTRIKRLDLLKLSYEVAQSVNEGYMKESAHMPDWLDFKYDFLKADLPEKVAQLKDVIKRI